MTQNFYVNASGPAKFSVFGRVYKLQGGEGCGPFPVTALEQVNTSRDRHLLHIVKTEVPAEVLPAADANDEYFEPIGNTVDTKGADAFTTTESINLFPDAVKQAEEVTESTVGEVLPEPIAAEPLTTSSLEPLAGAFTTEEKEEEEEDAPKVRSRRTRKPKAAE